MAKTASAASAKGKPRVRPVSPPARSNAGGVTRGTARAAQVKVMNTKAKPKPPVIVGGRKPNPNVEPRRPGTDYMPRTLAQGGRNKTSKGANVKKQSRATMNRGRSQRAAAASTATRSAAPAARQMQDYAGDPLSFLGSFFSGGLFGPKKK